MTGFDLAVIAVVALSTLLAFVRGVVRELIALATWIAGRRSSALAFDDAVAAALPGAGRESRRAAGARVRAGVRRRRSSPARAVAYLLSRLIHAAGLGFVDRFLGAFFGLARGLAMVVLFVLVAGVTALPRNDWWQNASLGRRRWSTAALALRPWLPRGVGRAARLFAGRTPARAPRRGGGRGAHRRT